MMFKRGTVVALKVLFFKAGHNFNILISLIAINADKEKGGGKWEPASQSASSFI